MSIFAQYRSEKDKQGRYIFGIRFELFKDINFWVGVFMDRRDLVMIPVKSLQKIFDDCVKNGTAACENGNWRVAFYMDNMDKKTFWPQKPGSGRKRLTGLDPYPIREEWLVRYKDR